MTWMPTLIVVVIGFLIGGLGRIVGSVPSLHSEVKRRERYILSRFPSFASAHDLIGRYPLVLTAWPPRLETSSLGLPVPLTHYVVVGPEDSAHFYAMGNGKPYEVLEAWVVRTGNRMWWTDRRLAVASYALYVVGAAIALVGAAVYAS